MSIKKLSFMLLSTLSLAALLNGCGSSSKEGASNPGGVAKTDEATCRVCHSTSIDPLSAQPILADFLTSPHSKINPGDTEAPGCQGCHGGGAQHNGVGPIPFPNPLASDRCKVCHTNPPAVSAATDFIGSCAPCHTTSGTGSIHAAQIISATTFRKADNCVGCHDIAAPQHGSLVGDNDGVRAIIPEFSKRSHHITGAAPTNAQCVVCHLEGKVVAGAIVVDTTKHMADASIHLRNADTNADFVWSGTEHTNMDNFCFSCHDSDGATTVPTTFTGVAGFTGTAANPFGDTLTNGYDQVTRAGVVDVKTAFTTTNASHHAVSGQRYKYRFSTAANAAVWAARTGKPMPAASEIAEGHTDLDGNPIDAAAFAETMTGDFTLDTTALPDGSFPAKGEGEATLYEASKFVATYIPLGATQNVADNSTLHCGDCHTVGQWTKGSSTSADGSKTPIAIGAHGSANEYLLRNSLGTDALHNSLTYVCFNCHVAGVAVGTKTPGAAGFGLLHPNQYKNQIKGYATAHAVSAFHIQCLADSADNIGNNNAVYPAGTTIGGVDWSGRPVPKRLISSWEGDKVKIYDYVPAPGATAALPATTATSTSWLGQAGGSDNGSGNITGIACTNCHNSALRSGFGGIHGGDNSYTDGLGRPQKSYRFMPGMGNYRYAPPGGWDNKDISNPALVTVAGNAAGIPGGKPMGGCYTNGAATALGDQNPGYSACNHHGTSTVGVGAGGYNGGTTGNGNGSGTNGGSDVPGTTAVDRNGVVSPTSSLENPAWEPTVREATAGNALVTRPLKY